MRAKKMEKSRKKGGPSGLDGRVGGLAEAAGKVRKGKPSGPGQHTHWFRTTPAPARGTANLNRCARSPYPRGTPQSGLLRLDAEPAWNQQEGIQKSYQNRVRDGPWCLQNASGTHPEHTRATEMQKNGLRSQKGDGPIFSRGSFGTILGPGRDPKID